MPPKELPWEIKLVQDRYRWLKISREQAKMIFKYEAEKTTFPSEHYFSVWEELDYERTFFQGLLSPQQFENYSREYERQVEFAVQGLVESDHKAENEILYDQKLLHFYRHQLLPAFTHKSFLVFTVSLRQQRAKIDYLKSEHKLFLLSQKAEALKNHFRHYRTYQPNGLKATLLRHELLCVWPDYALFKVKAEEPLLTVVRHMETWVHRLTPALSKEVDRIMKQLSSYQDKLYKKYYGEPKGWTFTLQGGSVDEERTKVLLNWMLADSEQCGC